MKKLWKGSAIIGIMTVVLCLNGCGGSSMETAATTEAAAAAEDGYNNAGEIYEQEYVTEEAVEEIAEEGASVTSNRKLIKTVYMDVETENFDELLPGIEHKVEALGGYIENMHLYNGSSHYGKGNRSANLTVRIPKERLEEFVSQVEETSNVVSKNENTEDVTLQYVDLESHKKALETEQERLLELLEQATTMEDIIAIEERMSQVRYELESMESQLRTYDNLVDYSTVDISVSEVERLTPVEEVSDMQRMTQGFVQSVEGLFTGIKEFLIGVVICLPYLLFAALLVLIVILIIWAVSKRSMKKRMERMPNYIGSPNHQGYGMNPGYGRNQSNKEAGTQPMQPTEFATGQPMNKEE